MLIQLPDKTWIKPERIEMITVSSFPAAKEGDSRYNPKLKDYFSVNVDCGCEFLDRPDFKEFQTETREAAEALRDSIAAQINSACYEERKK